MVNAQAGIARTAKQHGWDNHDFPLHDVGKNLTTPLLRNCHCAHKSTIQSTLTGSRKFVVNLPGLLKILIAFLMQISSQTNMYYCMGWMDGIGCTASLQLTVNKDQ